MARRRYMVEHAGWSTGVEGWTIRDVKTGELVGMVRYGADGMRQSLTRADRLADQLEGSGALRERALREVEDAVHAHGEAPRAGTRPSRREEGHAECGRA